MRDVLALTGMHGSKEFVVYDDERLAFDEHLKLACGLAQHLRDRYGIAKGDRVAISARNYPEWIVAFFHMIQAPCLNIEIPCGDDPGYPEQSRNSAKRMIIFSGICCGLRGRALARPLYRGPLDRRTAFD